MNVEQRLRQAIQAGETLTIIYNGGSNPGATREIAPIAIAGNKVSAHCYSSNAVKSFAIDRIVLVDGQAAVSAPTWAPKPAEPVKYSTLSSLLEQNIAVWQSFGWHVELAETALSLHRYSKRGGQPLKYPDITLDYVQFSQSHESEPTVIRFVLAAENLAQGLAIEPTSQAPQSPRERQRPWVVRAKNETNAYSTLDKAAEKFSAHAIAFVPTANNNGA